MKRTFATILALLLILALVVPVSAQDIDVPNEALARALEQQGK